MSRPADSAPVLAVDIGGTFVRAALWRGTRLARRVREPWPPGSTPEQELAFAVESAARVVNGEAVAGVGIAHAALVDASGAVVTWPSRPAWAGLPLGGAFRRRFCVPTLLEDDANAGAVAECAAGAARGFRYALVATVGTGIGAGVVLDGRLYRGAHGWAGEIGHLVFDPDGPPCSCGRYGCLQILASGRALERAARRQGLGGTAELVAAAANGVPSSVAEIEASARRVAVVVANVVKLLDLEIAVVGGGVAASGIWWNMLQACIARARPSQEGEAILVRRTELGDEACLVGAAMIASRALSPEAPRP
jgi:glucokinase